MYATPGRPACAGPALASPGSPPHRGAVLRASRSARCVLPCNGAVRARSVASVPPSSEVNITNTSSAAFNAMSSSHSAQPGHPR